MEYTDEQLIERVESLPTFDSWRGVTDIWVRSKVDNFNVFDDKVYTFFTGDINGIPVAKPDFMMVCTGTSNAGSYGLLNFRKYNPDGCAVLCADTIVYQSHIFGFHHQKIPAYVQNIHAPFPYTRDNNLNEKAENYGQIYNDIIWANCHPAGWFSQFINNWSVACLVRNQKQQYDQWLKYMSKRPLNVCILNEF